MVKKRRVFTVMALLGHRTFYIFAIANLYFAFLQYTRASHTPANFIVTKWLFVLEYGTRLLHYVK
jgi:hypothetical protein